MRPFLVAKNNTAKGVPPVVRIVAAVAVLVVVVLVARTEWSPAPRTPASASEPTFSKDIAAIVVPRCGVCHRPGESGPFDLLTYDDFRERAPQIRTVINDRYMPPWKPVGKRGVFENDRSLTDEEIALITRWIDGGTPVGDASQIPPPPEWPTGWQLGQPDVIVELPEPFELPADGRDVYRNFVIPNVVSGRRYVRAFEFRPNSAAMHHAVLNIDRNGDARRRDEADPGPGWESMDPGAVQSPGGHSLVWTPGKGPVMSTGWVIDHRTDLVLQLHMQPTGKPEKVSPTFGLFFTERPPERHAFTLRFGDEDIDIAPGERGYARLDSYVLDVDVKLTSVFPHAHYIATEASAWAILPTGIPQEILRIDDWDFNWQDDYTLVSPMLLPKGTTLFVRYTYDNSADNIRNPNTPPKRVVFGEQSTDEMGNVTFRLEAKSRQDLEVLREAKYRRILAAGPDARAYFNLANVLARRGRAEEAIASYLRAIEADAKLHHAHFNLGSLYLRRGEHAKAVEQLQLAIEKHRPFPEAHTNLGGALASLGKIDEALKQYQLAIEEDAEYFPARASLAQALAQNGRAEEAIPHFEKASSLRPTNVLVQVHWATALQGLGRRKEAIARYRAALKLQPDLAEIRKALGELEASP